MSSTLSHLSESGKLLYKKKPSLTETVIELFSTLRFSVHETRRKCICKRIVQAILNKVVARFLLHQFREKQNYGTIQLQGTAGETLERPSRWSLLDVQARRKVTMI